MNAISTIATTSSETNTDPFTCNFKNCSISNAPTHSNKTNRKNEIAFQTPNRIKKNGESSLALIRNQSNHTILPPPLFNENTNMSTATLPLLPNDSVRQLKSRRHHRTIPRHFTLTDPTNNATLPNSFVPKTKLQDDANKTTSNCSITSGSATLNKKSICQCPVPHFPHTYMGPAHLNLTRNQQPNEILLSTLTRKWPHHKSHVAKSASFTSTPSGNLTPSSSTTALGYNRNSASGLLSASNPNNQQFNNNNSSSQNSEVNQQPKTPSKIITISKQIGNNEINAILQSQQVQEQQSNDLIDTKSMHELLPISISSKGDNINNMNIQKPSNAEKNELHTNPILPPKLSKSQILNRHTENVKVISKSLASNNSSSNALPMPVLFKNHQRSNRDRSKSPSTADKTYSLVTPLTTGTDQKISHIKTTFPTTSNLTIASNHLSLPKPSNAIKTSMINNKNIQNSLNSNRNMVLPTSRQTEKLQSSSSKLKTSTNSNGNSELESKTNVSLSDARNHLLHSHKIDNEKSLPVCTTFKNCSNPKEHFLPNDTSLDDDYLSECENCKSAHGSRYYLDKEHEEQPQETMTLQRKMDEKENDEQPYYRTSSTLPTNTRQKST